MKIIERHEKIELERFLEESKSFREFLMKIGSSSNGSGSYKSIKNQLKSIGIEIKDFKYKSIIPIKKTNEEVFTENSNFSRQHLKKRIIKNNIIEYKCSECKNDGIWNNKRLSLQLEHKNGVNDDNRIENLTFLCPNCHSQTDTYSGKNNKKSLDKEIEKKQCKCGKYIRRESENCIECNSIKSKKIKDRPTLEQLLKEIEETNYVLVGKKYGVSDNCIRKWIKQYRKSISFI
jgi:hypothetical protein